MTKVKGGSFESVCMLILWFSTGSRERFYVVKFFSSPTRLTSVEVLLGDRESIRLRVCVSSGQVLLKQIEAPSIVIEAFSKRRHGSCTSLRLQEP